METDFDTLAVEPAAQPMSLFARLRARVLGWRWVRSWLLLDMPKEEQERLDEERRIW
ncbi:MAG: hypothetical protein ACK4PH_09430 [Aquincola tertiaricarbonis]